MSRIEEALRRVKNPGDPKDAPKGAETAADQPFLPAWPETEGDHAGREAGEPEREPLPRGKVSISSTWREQLGSGPGGNPVLLEQFRRLAATLHQARQTQSLRTVMVTSATPGDGKTLTACNLAFVLAESYGYRVLLMDADLRRPSISNMIDLPEGGVGLAEALRAPTAQKLALVSLTSRLTLLPAGRPINNSISALVSPRMRLILEEASTKFDWVIVDAPPVGPTSDARLLSQMIGGTLFVIRAGKSQYADVQRGIDAVGREQILGVVLNDVEMAETDGYYYVGTETGDQR